MTILERLEEKKVSLILLGQEVPEGYEEFNDLKQRYELLDLQINMIYVEIGLEKTIENEIAPEEGV